MGIIGKLDLSGEVEHAEKLKGQVSTDQGLHGAVGQKTNLAGNVAIGNMLTVQNMDDRYYFNSLALAKAAAATAKEVGSTDTVYYYGMKLLVDDGVFAKWYIIQRDGTLRGEGIEIDNTDETLIIENGILKVNTTNDIAANNKLPITSAGVYTQLGDLGALLKTI
jgi:hypothetical protein